MEQTTDVLTNKKSSHVLKSNFICTVSKGVLCSILYGYSQIFFAKNALTGFLFLAATFVVPSQGIAGLFGLITSNLWAKFFGYPDDHIKQGYFAYNGLLIGLALGLTYKVNTAFVVLMIIATAIGVVIAATLRTLFERYLFIPVLSLPFVLTTWLVIAGGRAFGALEYTLRPYQVSWLLGSLPEKAELFLRSFGAALFQLSIPSAVLIIAGIIVFSRHAFLLGALGLFSGTLVYGLLKGNPGDLQAGLIGFNFALTAIAVGGIWIVPGVDSFVLALIGGGICAVISAASVVFLRPLGLPVLAFPFVASTCIIIYSLKHRTVVKRFKTITIPEATPEKNLKRHKNVMARFVTGEIPAFELPVSGQWCITQGFNGEHTHKELWAHAWDFEIIDEQGKPCEGDGVIPEEFYSFNMPVLAPADGKVVTVINHIQDNPVGKVNIKHNWGNVVILWHYGSVYTALCHFKRESIVVKEGEVVRRGQILGRVGNSGRSSIPHLHFQVQLSPAIGAPTTPSELMHYTCVENGKVLYFTHGCPVKGQKIKALETDSMVFDTASFTFGRIWKYMVSYNGRQWQESWKVEVDFAGNRHLVSVEKGARLRFYADSKVLLFLDYDGPRNTGLQLLFMGVPRLPMSRGKIYWQDELPGDLLLPPLSRVLFDLAEPFLQCARLVSNSRFLETGNRFTVETDLMFTGFLADRKRQQIKIISTFEPQVGLIHMELKGMTDNIFEVRLVEVGTEHEKVQFKETS